jgi:arylsulfatase A-like enzyme
VKQLKPLLVFAVLANLVVVALLLLRNPVDPSGTDLGSVIDDLIADQTMEAARYDLRDRAGELNVILISLDALRWDRTGLSGNPDGLTPNLDAFAQEAVVFTDTTTAAPWTLPSHMTIWTGRWPSVHGITNKLKLLSQDQMVETNLSPGIETYPDLLIRQGFTAAGFTGGAGVQNIYGFGRGFDTYLDDRYFGGLDYSIPAALSWLEGHRAQRFFLFLHGYDAHGQFELPASELSAIQGYDGTLDGSKAEQGELREKALAAIKEPGDDASLSGSLDAADIAFLEDVYDRKVHAADERLGSFLARIKAQGLYDDSIIAIVSDHGDEFMEHGFVDHGAYLCQHQLGVVMMVRFPGYARRQDLDTPVRTIDLFATIFDAMGLDGPSGVDAVSLLPLLQGAKREPPPVYAETDYRLYVHQRMIRKGDWKLILDLQDGSRQLYDLSEDPEERNDLSSSEPRRTYEMEQALRGWMAETRTNPQDYLGLRQKPIKLF